MGCSMGVGCDGELGDGWANNGGSSMIIEEVDAFLETINRQGFEACGPAVPKAVFMVEPSGFRISEQSAKDNAYMDTHAPVDPMLALDQHRALAERITQLGVPVVRFVGQSKTPDDLFPNNVFATSAGRLIVGAMKHPERQLEAERSDIRAFFQNLMGYACTDLSSQGCVAELTGAMVIDRARRLGFCGMTPRVDEAGRRAMHEAFDLALTFGFDLKPNEYHTNVVMSVLASRALVICPDAFVDPKVPDAIIEAFNGQAVVISSEEKEAFAGNCLAVTDHDVMISQTAMEVLSPSTIATLEEWSFKLHPVAMDEIEKAGGSVRCCIGEIF